MRILGIDPGSRFTGYGVVEEQSGRLIHVDCGVIAPSPKLPMAQRLSHITDGLERVIAEHAPDAASIEEVFSGRNWRSALKLGQARGAALVALAHHNLDVAEYTPTVIKKTVVGYGRAEKEQIQHMVRVLLGLPENPEENAADALAIAICRLFHNR